MLPTLTKDPVFTSALFLFNELTKSLNFKQRLVPTQLLSPLHCGKGSWFGGKVFPKSFCSFWCPKMGLCTSEKAGRLLQYCLVVWLGRGTLKKLLLLSGSGELSCSVYCQSPRGHHLHHFHTRFTLGR